MKPGLFNFLIFLLFFLNQFIPASALAQPRHLSPGLRVDLPDLHPFFQKSVNLPNPGIIEYTGPVELSPKDIKISGSLHGLNKEHLEEAVNLSWRQGLDRFRFNHTDTQDGIDLLWKVGAALASGFGPITTLKEQEIYLKPPELEAHIRGTEETVRQAIPKAVSGEADIIIIGFECSPNPLALLKLIKQEADKSGKNIKLGFSLSAQTPVKEIRPFLPLVDQITILSSSDTISGFTPSALNKIRELRKILTTSRRKIEICVDGKIDRHWAQQAIWAGADVLVADKAIYGQTVFENIHGSRVTLDLAIDTFRQAAVSSAVPLSLDQQKKIVDHVLRRIEGLSRQRPVPARLMLYNNLRQRYRQYREQLGSGLRANLPKYYYGINLSGEAERSARKQGLSPISRSHLKRQIEHELRQFFRRKILRTERLGFGDEGVLLRDRIIDRDNLDQKTAGGYRDYSFWLALSGDIDLQGRHVSYHQGPLSTAFRFRDQENFSGGLLLDPSEISAIVIAARPTSETLKQSANNLPVISKSGIPVISIEEAGLEQELIDEARRLYDRFNLIKEGKYRIASIIPVSLTANQMRTFARLTDGQVVMVALERPSQKVYGYITEKNGRKYVTCLDTVSRGYHGTINSSQFIEREIKLTQNRPERLRPEEIRLASLELTNARIDRSKLGTRNFLLYLLEKFDTRVNRKPIPFTEYQPKRKAPIRNAEVITLNFPLKRLHPTRQTKSLNSSI